MQMFTFSSAEFVYFRQESFTVRPLLLFQKWLVQVSQNQDGSGCNTKLQAPLDDLTATLPTVKVLKTDLTQLTLFVITWLFESPWCF